MKKVTRCIICGSDIINRKRGMVSPFLARRIWNRPAFGIDLVECVACSFVFFNPRIDEGEEKRLYINYRSAEYQKTRQELEPWYTRKVNDRLMTEEVILRRKTQLSEILSDSISAIAQPAILDFGGDRGQLVQGLFPNSSNYVYDISQVSPLPGVIPCRTLGECKERKFDVIICSNTLEHVGFPCAIVDQIMTIAAPHTLIFVEVPFEVPTAANLILRRLVQVAILAAFRPSVAVGLMGVSALYQMHEHINFFNSKSLGALVVASGGSVVSNGEYNLKGALGGVTMGWCFGNNAGGLGTSA